MGVMTNVGGGGGRNVRYDPATDMVQIKYNGVWTDWKSGNMQRHYLYRDGEQVVNWDNSGFTFRASDGWVRDGGATLEANDFYFSAVSPNSHYRTIGTYDKIDMTDFSYICAEYDGDEYRFDVTNSKAALGNNLYISALLLHNGSTKQLYMKVDNSKAGSGAGIYLITQGTASGIGSQPFTKIWLE